MTCKVYLVLLVSFCSLTAIAQKQLTTEETQNFYKLIKQTPEYKHLKERTDSFNNAAGENLVPQETDIEMLKSDQSAANDDPIFWASLERKLAIGFTLDKYLIKYDKQKKQIVSVELQMKRTIELK